MIGYVLIHIIKIETHISWREPSVTWLECIPFSRFKIDITWGRNIKQYFLEIESYNETQSDESVITSCKIKGDVLREVSRHGVRMCWSSN